MDDPRHAVTRRLGQRVLDLVPIIQDGNLQFRSVAQQIFEDQSLQQKKKKSVEHPVYGELSKF